MIQPNISLAVETPQVEGPLESYSKALSIRGMQQQQLLHGEQLKSAQIANQEHVKAQQDDTLNTQTWQQANGDPVKHVEMFAKSGARPQAVQALQKHYADLRKEYAETGAKEAETKKYTNSVLAGITAKALADPDYEQNYPQYLAAAKQADPKVQLPEQAPPKDALAHIRLAYTTDEILHKEADETRAEAKRKEDAAAAARDAAKGPEELRRLKAQANSAESDAAIKQFEVDAAKATPEQQAAKVAATIDPTKYPEIYKRTLAGVTAAVTHQEKMSALHAGSAEVGEREKETDPNIRKARTQQAVDTEQALTPLKIKQAVDTEVAKAKLAPESFASIVDPRARASAEANYEKDSKEYADKVSESRRLKDLISAAQSGNKAAPGVIPIEELRGFVNRVNTQELRSVSSGAGSLADRIIGKIGGLKSGQSIPPDILKDTAELAGLNEKAARGTYEMKVQVNNKTHGGNVKPIDFATTSGDSGGEQKVTTQAQYDALASGATYTGEDGKKYKKP